jgi:hypothetical protein
MQMQQFNSGTSPANNFAAGSGTTNGILNGDFVNSGFLNNNGLTNNGQFTNNARLLQAQQLSGMTVLGPLSSNSAFTVVTNGAGQSFILSPNGALQALLPGVNAQQLVGSGLSNPSMSFDMQGNPLPTVTRGLLDSSNLAALAMGVNGDLVANGNLTAFNPVVNPASSFFGNELAAQNFAFNNGLLALNSANAVTGNQKFDAARSQANRQQEIASNSNLAALAMGQRANPNNQGNLAALGFGNNATIANSNLGMLAQQSNSGGNLASLALGSLYGANGNLAALPFGNAYNSGAQYANNAAPQQSMIAQGMSDGRSFTAARVYKSKKTMKKKKSQRRYVARRVLK